MDKKIMSLTIYMEYANQLIRIIFVSMVVFFWGIVGSAVASKNYLSESEEFGRIEISPGNGYIINKKNGFNFSLNYVPGKTKLTPGSRIEIYPFAHHMRRFNKAFQRPAI